MGHLPTRKYTVRKNGEALGVGGGRGCHFLQGECVDGLPQLRPSRSPVEPPECLSGKTRCALQYGGLKQAGRWAARPGAAHTSQHPIYRTWLSTGVAPVARVTVFLSVSCWNIKPVSASEHSKTFMTQCLWPDTVTMFRLFSSELTQLTVVSVRTSQAVKQLLVSYFTNVHTFK